jgi:hypothetical protein
MKVFDIKLERNEYSAGKTAKGHLLFQVRMVLRLDISNFLLMEWR